MFTNRFSSLTVNGKTLRNRVVIPPMASGTADERGFATAETLQHYERLAQAQPGLLIVEYTYVHPTGRSEDHQLGIWSDAHIAGLTSVAKTIRSTGAIAGIQFSHGGGKTERALTGGVLMGPSAIPVPMKDRAMERPTPMTTADIELWKQAFVQAVDRAMRAGFELVELHSAHGYGLNQWLSPLTNQRQDEYGVTLQGRMKMLLDIVTEIRARHPQLVLSVRMPGQDFIAGGLQISDTITIARALVRAGVNIIHVSSGIGGWRRPITRQGQGYLVDEAAAIQAQIANPVIGVGGIESGGYIDQGLVTGRFALAAVGRAILHDPRVWYEAHLALNPPPAVVRTDFAIELKTKLA